MLAKNVPFFAWVWLFLSELNNFNIAMRNRGHPFLELSVINFDVCKFCEDMDSFYKVRSDLRKFAKTKIRVNPKTWNGGTAEYTPKS